MAATHRNLSSSYEIESAPPSQASSFNNPIESQQFDILGMTAKDRHSLEDISHRAATPATSLSNNSSQERATANLSNRPSPVNFDGNGISIARPINSIQSPSKTYPPSQPSPSQRNHTSAPKRYLDGNIKSSSNSIATSPTEEQTLSHSRTSSTASREGQAADVSRRFK